MQILTTVLWCHLWKGHFLSRRPDLGSYLQQIKAFSVNSNLNIFFLSTPLKSSTDPSFSSTAEICRPKLAISLFTINMFSIVLTFFVVESFFSSLTHEENMFWDTNHLLSVKFMFFLFSSSACISKYSAGSIFYYPSFHYIHNPAQLEKFQRDLERYLTRKIGFEAVMRIRCTKGNCIKRYTLQTTLKTSV